KENDERGEGEAAALTRALVCGGVNGFREIPSFTAFAQLPQLPPVFQRAVAVVGGQLDDDHDDGVAGLRVVEQRVRAGDAGVREPVADAPAGAVRGVAGRPLPAAHVDGGALAAGDGAVVHAAGGHAHGRGDGGLAAGAVGGARV